MTAMKARLCTLFAALCLVALPAYAENAGEIRQRMEQRLSTIDDLKAKEVIGENNRGFVEVRGSGSGDAARSGEIVERDVVGDDDHLDFQAVGARPFRRQADSVPPPHRLAKSVPGRNSIRAEQTGSSPAMATTI